MSSHDELFAIADKMDSLSTSSDLEAAKSALGALDVAVFEVERAFSGSWLGYHANVYYENLIPPPPGAHFSQEWGLMDMSFSSLGSTGKWCEYEPHELENRIRTMAGMPDLSAINAAASSARTAFNEAKAETQSILLTDDAGRSDAYISRLLSELDDLQPLSARNFIQIWSPKGKIMTRDTVALGQANKVPPHCVVKAEIASIRHAFSTCQELARISRKAASHLERKTKRVARDSRIGTNVFIGHGRSPAWRELKDFVQDRLQLPWDEFNRVPVAGTTNQARLSEMLDSASVALVIMTAEDENADGELHARMNVIHEVGLFQGRLGFTRAIILVEEGCKEFSNIQGLGQIRFPSGRIDACFEEIRRVLEREGLV